MKSFQRLLTIALVVCCGFAFTNLQAQTPLNDSCVVAQAITAGGIGTCPGNNVNFTLIGATPDGNFSCDAIGTNYGVWFSFIAPSAAVDITVDDEFAVFDACNGNELLCQGPFSSTTYTLGGLTTGNTYYVVVWEDFNVTSGTNNICIAEAAPPPSNDDCAGAIPIGVASSQLSCVPTAVNTTSATQSSPNPSCTSTSNNDDVWYSFFATGTTVQVEFDNIVGSTSVGAALYDGCGGTQLFCDANSTGSNPDLSDKFNGLTIGNQYFLRVWIPGSADGTFDMCVFLPPPPPINDDCSGALAVPFLNVAPNEPACTTINVDTRNATNSSAPTGCTSTSQNDDVWYAFIAPPGGQVRMRFTNIVGTTSVGSAVYDGCNGSLVAGSCDFNSAGTPDQSEIVSGLITGALYYVRLWLPGSTVQGTFDLCMYAPPGPPANDDCSGAQPIVVGGVGSCPANETTFSLEFATPDGNFTCDAIGSNYGVWFQFVATAANLDIDVSNEFAVFDACNGNEIFCDDQFGAPHSLQGLTIGATYVVVVWEDSQGSTTQNSICVSETPPPPGNDECAGATPITMAADQASCGASTVAVTTANALQSSPNPSCTSTANDDDVWFQFTATAEAVQVQFDNLVGIPNSVFSVGSALYEGSCGSLTELGCDFASTGANPELSDVFCGLTIGNTYYLRVWSNSTTNDAAFDMCVFGVPTDGNDDVCDAVAIPFGVTPFNNACATAQLGEPSPGPGTGGSTCNSQDGWCSFEVDVDNSLWFTFVAPASGCVSIVADGFDTQLAVWEVSNCNDFNSFVELAANDDGGDDILPSAAGLSAGIDRLSCLTPGATYWIQLDGYNGATGTGDLHLIDCGNDPLEVAIGSGCMSRFVGWGPAEDDTLYINANISGGFPPYSISWAPNDTSILFRSFDELNIAVQPEVTTTYTASVTDSRGCVATDTVTVVVIDVVSGCSNNNNLKVQVCHVPPGNQANRHNICISPNAIAAHLPPPLGSAIGHSNCYLGPCANLCRDNGIPFDPPPPCGATQIDDFDPGIDGGAWASIVNGTASANCGSGSGNALYFNSPSFGDERSATTNPISISSGAVLRFGLVFGSGSAPCENADGGEDVILEYSTDGGLTFFPIATYDTEDFTTYTVINALVPQAALTANTQFRWSQVAHSGQDFDNWAIDDIEIICVAPPPPPPACTASDIDDFDPGIDAGAWALIQNGTADVTCGSVSGNALYFNGSGDRSAETNPVSAGLNSNLQFDLFIAASSTTGCEDADPGEEVVLEYQNTLGGWVNIATYSTTAFGTFTTVTEPVPAAAQSASAKFRWRQLSNTGNNFDNWAIDNVSITCSSNKGAASSAAAASFGENAEIEVSAYPNPFSNTTSIEFTVPTDEYVTLEVYAVTGVKVATLYDDFADAGVHYKQQFSGKGHADGVYFYRVITRTGDIVTGKVQLQR